MASMIQELKLTGFASYLPAVESPNYEHIYEENRHRVYALSFWMTDNEMAAEELMSQVFRRAFAACDEPNAETIDRALIAELRETAPLGVLTLECTPAAEVLSVRNNVLRVHLERAVVQLPRTERLIFLMHDAESYSHERIACTLGLNEDESRHGLHQARLRVRELLAAMR
jgi:RNA polymerase sigma-70 factor, ECF subfamily